MEVRRELVVGEQLRLHFLPAILRGVERDGFWAHEN